MTPEDVVAIIKPHNDELVAEYRLQEALKENAELRRQLEYAYRRIEYGFVHGVFDFSVLRTDASNYLADLEAAEAKATT